MLEIIVMESMVEIGSSGNWMTDLGMPRILLPCISLLIFAVANSCGGNMPNSYIIQKPAPKCNFLGAAALSGWRFRQLQGWLTPLLTMLRAVKPLLEVVSGSSCQQTVWGCFVLLDGIFPTFSHLRKKRWEEVFSARSQNEYVCLLLTTIVNNTLTQFQKLLQVLSELP